MNDIQILSYNDQSIRQTVSEDGEILFCAKDIANALGYEDAHHITRILDEDDPLQIVEALDSKKELRKMPFVTEHQIYSILMALRTDRTKPFRRWVTHEVLPSIRKTGSYSLNQPAEISYRNKRISPTKAEDLLKSKDARIKELLPYKNEFERRQDVATDYRSSHRKTKIRLINIDTCKLSTLWNLPYDVLKYLESLSLVERGRLFHRWKHQHNFSEFVRFRMKKEGFRL